MGRHMGQEGVCGERGGWLNIFSWAEFPPRTSLRPFLSISLTREHCKAKNQTQDALRVIVKADALRAGRALKEMILSLLAPLALRPRDAHAENLPSIDGSQSRGYKP